MHKYLRSIRQSYLSTSLPTHRNRHLLTQANSSTSDRAPGHHHTAAKDRQYFTDAQRDQIDAESKATLRDLNAGIRQIEEAEQLRKETEVTLAEHKKARHGFKALGRWAAGDLSIAQRTPEEALETARQETIKVHRESVVWYLRKKLEEAAGLQSGMMQTRLDREVEKSKSVLYKTRGVGGGNDALSGLPVEPNSPASLKSRKDESISGGYKKTVPATDNSEKNIEQTLSPEQLQQFAQENSDMLKNYEDTLDKVRCVCSGGFV